MAAAHKPEGATMPTHTNHILFNCCPDNAEPDWSKFAFLVVGGCIEDTDNPGSIIGGQEDCDAQFWSVYAYRKDGECEAITDAYSRQEADDIARQLSGLSRLPIKAT
jgi:hypothetical protein